MNFAGQRSVRDDALLLLSDGPLNPFVDGRRVHWIDGISDPDATIDLADVAISYRNLEDIPDYRSALQTWFSHLPVGGHLIIIVPHAFLYERQLGLPSPWRPRQRRLYTPAALLTEVEEALVPNSYRVRWLGDLDNGYDYQSDPESEPSGGSDIALVLERIVSPDWSLSRSVAPGTSTADRITLAHADFAFEPERTRVETDAKPVIRRILILKLDHLGDLIMGLPALKRLRHYFADAHIDLVVGSWNVAMARDLELADRVLAFDAFPRNSSEEEPNVSATLGFFRSQITNEYDLAIDLRTDTDTRQLLHAAKARLKAGVGTRAQFPFLDIALPLDSTRNEAERVRDDRLSPHSFFIQDAGRRTHFALYSDKKTVERAYAIIWGPYLELDPGDYIFDFYIDLEERRGDGLLRLDIALEHGKTVSEMIVSGPTNFHLPFRIDKPKTPFEARIATVEGHPSINFGFHGGRLIKKGPGNVLHQSEYTCLLAELIKLRVQDLGVAHDVSAA